MCIQFCYSTYYKFYIYVCVYIYTHTYTDVKKLNRKEETLILIRKGDLQLFN